MLRVSMYLEPLRITLYYCTINPIYDTNKTQNHLMIKMYKRRTPSG